MSDSGNRIYIIKWTNKYSNEVGYVRYIKEEKRHFINTYDKSEAEKYRTKEKAEIAIDVLNAIGEGKMNQFSIECYLG